MKLFQSTLTSLETLSTKGSEEKINVLSISYDLTTLYVREYGPKTAASAFASLLDIFVRKTTAELVCRHFSVHGSGSFPETCNDGPGINQFDDEGLTDVRRLFRVNAIWLGAGRRCGVISTFVSHRQSYPDLTDLGLKRVTRSFELTELGIELGRVASCA